jgi:hypothetical protein
MQSFEFREQVPGGNLATARTSGKAAHASGAQTCENARREAVLTPSTMRTAADGSSRNWQTPRR